MATEKQIEANRLNAQKSTGPRTDDGKDASRRNALKHGLAGRGIVFPEAFEDEVADRAAQINSSLKPFDAFEMWLAENIARDQVRIDDLVRRQLMRRCELAERARLHWDDDRRADALLLVEDLAKHPAAAGGRLQQSPQGCALMSEYWQMLLTGLDSGQPWDDGRRHFALDLLGVPKALRTGPTALDAPAGAEPVPHCRAVAQAEIERLRARAAGPIAGFDAQRKYEAELGLVEDDPVLKLLRRYEAECSRRITKFRAMFKQQSKPELVARPRQDEPTNPRPRDEAALKHARAAIAARAVLPPEEVAPIAECAAEPLVEEWERPEFAMAGRFVSAVAPGVAAAYARAV